ncbi:type II secretion system protein [bacterium]|nr:type II secretion system protein [bacterium]
MKRGFTLAEVLITLGIIGVVAAITLSTLIKEYHKHVWVNQLKANYSILNQGFQKMMADDGVNNIEDTEVWRTMQGGCGLYVHEPTSDNCKNFLLHLKKYFNIVSVKQAGDYKFSYLNNTRKISYYGYPGPGKDIYTINFANGAMMVYNSFHNITDRGYIREVGNFELDINGHKGPNTYGRDIFIFALDADGKLYPSGGSNFPPEFRWTSSCQVGVSSSNGSGCAARIMENGWKMDY